MPNADSIALLGGGGHALVVAEAASLAGLHPRGIFDDADAPVATRLHIPRVGPLRDFLFDSPWILCIGSLAARRNVIAASRGVARTIVHPRAFVSPSSSVGDGTFIGPSAIVHTLARIGPHCIINTGAIVEHECILDENVHIAPSAALAGNVRVGRDTMIGLGAKVLPGISIGRNCTIGAGAVVVGDVPDNATVVGVPGRER